MVPSAAPVPPIFSFLQRVGGVETAELDRTFNMGLGMIVVASPDDATRIEAHLDTAGEAHHAVGEVTAGSGEVVYV